MGWQYWSDSKPTTESSPWFAGYVDVTATPNYAFEQPRDRKVQDAILSFIVSDSEDACAPSWGTHYSMAEAEERLDLDRRIARLRQQGGHISVSFGGAINDELAVKCTNPSELVVAYGSVVDRYKLDTIDLDLENDGLTDTDAGKRRGGAIAALQKERRADDKELSVWVTLPVTPAGLTKAGTDAVALLLSSGVDLAGVNGMTMDYGKSREKGQSMSDAAAAALTSMHRQLSVLFDKAKLHQSDTSLWGKIGATPMIGQNDVRGEIFTLKDAQSLNAFARSKGVGRLSMWSSNRDHTCGSNYVDLTTVSDSCSGVDQGENFFAETLRDGFRGTLSPGSEATPTAAATKAVSEDDPKTSPYPVWNEENSYAKETKVVWHNNVYQAKWWTRNEVPDNPVLKDYETPWRLIGPVLPNETPAPALAVPEGVFSEWVGTSVYEKGSKVSLDGSVYEAKWWTQGDCPEASTLAPADSPWVALTQSEIDMIVDEDGLFDEHSTNRVDG